MTARRQLKQNLWRLVLGLPLAAILEAGAAAAATPEPQAQGVQALVRENQEQQESLLVLQAAAARGDTAAEYKLGMRHLTGQGVAQDDVMARRWLERAAKGAHAAAAYQMGGLCLHGRGGSRNEKEAFRWYYTAAELEYPAAEFNLGLLYANGTGTGKDESAAVLWYTRAADRGFPDAQYKLAMMYMLGRGVPKDAEKARSLYTLATAIPNNAMPTLRNASAIVSTYSPCAKSSTWSTVEQETTDLLAYAERAGDGEASMAIGTFYANCRSGGNGVGKNAADYYRRAALHEIAEALRALGELYWHGRGVASSKVKAYALLSLAAARGDADAAETAALIAVELSEDERVDSRRLAEKWPSGSEWRTRDSGPAP